MFDHVLGVLFAGATCFVGCMMIWDRIGQPRPWRNFGAELSADSQPDRQTDRQTEHRDAVLDETLTATNRQVDRTLTGLVTQLAAEGWSVSQIRAVVKGDNAEIGRQFKLAIGRQLATAAGVPEVLGAHGQREPMTYPISMRSSE